MQNLLLVLLENKKKRVSAPKSQMIKNKGPYTDNATITKTMM